MSNQPDYKNYPQRAPSNLTKGHDSVLKAIQNRGTKLHVQLMSGETRVGLIVGRDKFTVTLLCEDKTRRVIYKHAIEEFWTVESESTPTAD